MTQETASTLYSTAIAAIKKNSLFEAETALAQAISLDESNAAYWEKLGLVWAKMNRHGEAVEALTMASSLSPENADIFYNKGISHLHIGDNDNGISSLEKSFKLSNNDELAEKLADIFIEKSDFQSAAYYLLHIYKKKKEMSREDICSKLANCLFRNGDVEGSHTITLNLVKRFPNNQRYADMIVDIYRRRQHHVFDQDSKNVLERLLQKDTTKFIFLRNPWISLFLLDKTYEPLRIFTTEQTDGVDLNSLSKILSTDFLCLGLHRGIATHLGIENILTNLRKYFLLRWSKAETWPPVLTKFLVALAASCWNTEYVYFETPEEKSAVADLKKHIESYIAEKKKDNDTAHAMEIALLACYIPLYSFCADKNDICVAKKFQSYLAPLIETQITNPQTESKLAADIKSFTTVDDKISLSVQAMYASRPYPRWFGTVINECSQATKNIGNGIDVLVAGCGTGHEPALYANNLPLAHITAIDLSLPSIAYGKRMAIQLGIADQITFLQGDLMKVEELDKKFDFVASSGVLHHLKDPEKGLRAILKTLKPDGRMSISLYSKVARDHALNPAMDYIKSKGYTPSLDDIRQFRKDVMGMTTDNPATRCTTAGDFYSLAECNDLLFHIQEHRYTPHQIWDMADRHGLEPILVSITPERMKKFRDIFPDGNTLDPDRLDAFEKEHPLAFIEMIKIFFKRKGSTAPNSLDYLIYNQLL